MRKTEATRRRPGPVRRVWALPLVGLFLAAPPAAQAASVTQEVESALEDADKDWQGTEWLYAAPPRPTTETLADALRQGQYRDVLKKGRALLARRSTGELYSLLGVALAALGQADEAAGMLDKAADTDAPVGLLHRLGRGMIHAARQEYDEALAAYKEAIRLDEGHPLAYAALGKAEFDRGRYRQAEESLARAVALEPRLAHGYTLLAAAYFVQKKIPEAFAAYRQAAEIDPRDARPHMGLATIYSGLNRWQEAIVEYETVLRLNPASLQARKQVARLYLRTGQYDDAIAAAREVVRREPSSDEGLFVLGRAYSFTNRFDDAVTPLRRLAAARPEAVAGRYLLGLCLMAQEDFAAAAQLFQELERQAPQSDVAVALGVVWHVVGDHRQAGAAFERALGTGDADGLVRLLLANLHASTQQAAAAQRHLAQARGAFPYLHAAAVDWESMRGRSAASSLAQTNLAALYLAKGWPDKAVERCDAALQAFGTNPLALYIKGKSLAHRQDLAGAAEQFSRAIEAEPRLASAHFDLAETRAAQADFSQAVAAYGHTAALVPQDAGIYLRLGAAHALAGDGAAAVRAYQKAIALAPESASGYNQLAYFYAEKEENLDEALTLAQQATNLAPADGAVLDTLGWVHFKRAEYGAAAEAFAAALRSLPYSPTVRYHLGLTHLKRGEPQRAAEELTNALRISRRFPEAAYAATILQTLQSH